MGRTYDLMHRNIEVSTVELDEDYGNITNIVKVHDIRHMPVGTVVSGYLDGQALRRWWGSRSIPASRSGIRDFLESLDLIDARLLLTKSMGLSLSDQYWIRPVGSDVKWEDVNFFDNPFSDDVGDLLFGGKVSGVVNLMSPDNTSDGNLQKRWKIIDGRRCLIKGSVGIGRQEPFNEVIASRLMDALDIPHVDYRIAWISERPYSVCEDFVDRDTELVSAYSLIVSRKRRNDRSLYQHYVECCADIGIDIVPFLDRMMVLDHIIGNYDRHTNNFGLIRDARTLEWLGPAPVFDSGSSLGCQLLTGEIMGQAGVRSKPFRELSSQQIGLVTSLDWVDFDSLDGVMGEIGDVLDGSRGIIDPERRDVLLGFVRSRIDELRAMADRVRRPSEISHSRTGSCFPRKPLHAPLRSSPQDQSSRIPSNFEYILD